MNNRSAVALTILLSIMMLMVGLSTIAAGEDVNVGLLRVSVQHPRFAAPSSHVSFLVDVEYAVHDNATIKSSLFSGTLHQLGPELWHSESVPIQGPILGDKTWTVDLTAPANEGEMQFVAIAYYQNAGKYSANDTTNNQTSAWSYYNDTDYGPSFLEFTVKISQTAQLEVDLSVSNVAVRMGDSTAKTSAEGAVASQFNVGENVTVSVPEVLPLENSTRLVFQGWQGGGNSTNTSVLLDGDIKLVGVYKPQYLLRVDSPASVYVQSKWYEPGSNVTLEVNSSVPMDWPLGALGVHYIFKGWTGDVTSNANKITLSMNTPKVVNANFTPDLTPLVLPVIVMVGVVGGVTLALVRRRKAAKTATPEEEIVEEAAEVEEGAVPTMEEATEGDSAPIESQSSEKRPLKFCDGCGESIEENWTHCIHCGKALGGTSEPIEN
jgi:hypothetical protein